MATDENYEIIDISSDPYLERLIYEGEYFIAKGGSVCDYPLGTCHASVVKILLNEREEGDVLYTGLAQNGYNDEWFSHSFIINKGKIVEPGPVLFKAYFGIPLTGDDESEFINIWKD